MKRGDVFAAATGSGFGSKPRPVVIVQNDAFMGAPTVLVALLADGKYARPPIRPLIDVDAENRLHKASAVTVDKIVAVHRHKIGRQIGTLSAADMRRVDSALMVILGLSR